MLIKGEPPSYYHKDEGSELPLVIKIDDSNREEIFNIINLKQLVIVYCWYRTQDEAKITLSNETFLWDQLLDHRSKVLYSYGIVSPPEWQTVRWKSDAKFDLYFEPLPKECKSFWFWEQTRESFQFAAFDVKRNDMDEYWVGLQYCPF